MTTPFNQKDLTKTLKKAKRMTFLKIILLSLCMSVVILAVIFYGNRYWMGKMQTEVVREKMAEQAVMHEANTFIQMQFESTGFLKGTITEEIYKVIEDKVIPWDTQTIHYTNKGFESTTFASSTTTVNDTTTIQIPSGERAMQYYVPQYHYETYANDLEHITHYPNDKYMEMAISFDNSYSFEHVQKILPTSLHVTWYWVNNFTMKKQKRDVPELAGFLYGFSAPTNNTSIVAQTLLMKEEEPIDTPQRFLTALQAVSNEDYDMLKKRQHKNLIAGVVVTGTKKDLAVLKNQPYVKASSLGAVVDKY